MIIMRSTLIEEKRCHQRRKHVLKWGKQMVRVNYMGEETDIYSCSCWERGRRRSHEDARSCPTGFGDPHARSQYSSVRFSPLSFQLLHGCLKQKKNSHVGEDLLYYLLQSFFIDSNSHNWWSFKELTLTNGYILLIVLTRTNDKIDFPFPHLYYITWFEKKFFYKAEKLSVILHHQNLFSKKISRI